MAFEKTNYGNLPSFEREIIQILFLSNMRKVENNHSKSELDPSEILFEHKLSTRKHLR